MLLSPASTSASLPSQSFWNKLRPKTNKEDTTRQAQMALARQRLLTLAYGEMETIRMELEAVARDWARPPPDAVFNLRIPVEYASLHAARLIAGPYIYLNSEDSYQIAIMGVQGSRVEIVSDAPPPPDEPPPPPPPPVLDMDATFNLELTPGQYIALDVSVNSEDDMARMEDGTTVDGTFWGKLDIVHDGDTHKLEFTGTRHNNQPDTSPDFLFDSKVVAKLAVASKPPAAKCQLSILTPEMQYCDVVLSFSPLWKIGTTWPPAESVGENKIKFFLRVHPGGALEHFESEVVTTALYYEAIPDPAMIEPNDFIAPRNGFAMSFRDFIPHLINVLSQLGMSVHARTSFINNNMPAFAQHKNIAYRFLRPRQIAAAVDISVASELCVFTRLFLIFRGLSDDDLGIFSGAGEKEANSMNWREVLYHSKTMPKISQYELDREANIARNRALLEQLELSQAVASLPLKAAKVVNKAKPVQPAQKKRKLEAEAEAPRRQSARLRRGAIDPKETPDQKRKREAEEEERRAIEAEERLEAEERARAAKRPRHHELDLHALVGDQGAEELSTLSTSLKMVLKEDHPRRAGDIDAFEFEDHKEEEQAVKELRSKLQSLKVVARAKVTEDRVYSAAYHPEPSKDLIFFGDKHGQLGIWDARAPSDEVDDEDDANVASDNREGGKYWRLQLHWPATSKSSISCLKFNPTNSHSVYSASYDCTIRHLSFETEISTEVFSTEDGLISSFDLTPSGSEMWISDSLGGVTHVDLRLDKSKAQWYGLSDQKIGCLSLNPTQPNFMVTASNSRELRIWDIRKLSDIVGEVQDTKPPTSTSGSSAGDSSQFDAQTVLEYASSKKGTGCLRGEWRHDKSVSSAYWDPRGRGIVSTSYDDTLRLWDIKPSSFDTADVFPSSRPFSRIRHNCQTGRWLTILRAQWSPNPDVYPHFTIGNMDHSLDIFTCKGDLITRLSDPTK
ncbi:hypothetical protein ONZ45_g15069 [Pleurotus djamor]|nr:hypothetical protein ONZ45_g15069 [Pleurotus djamor]